MDIRRHKTLQKVAAVSATLQQ